MSRFTFTRRQLAIAGTAAAVFGLGLLVGLLVPAGGPRAAVDRLVDRLLGVEETTEEEPHDAHADEGYVELNQLQIDNLELQLGKVAATDESIDVRVPGRVVERPGFSDLGVASTMTGFVTKVHVVPGQAVRPGDPLFDLQLTGDALATSQSSLLRELAELDSINKEIDRLEPLVQSGSVAGRQLVQLKYDRTQVENRIRIRRQELTLYGLTADRIEGIVSTGDLVTDMTVRLPTRLVEDMPSTPVAVEPPDDLAPVVTDPTDTDWRFTIERLDAHVGLSVRPGDMLVRLAHHTELFVEGQAFENETRWIEDLEARDWTVTLETGTEGHERFLRGLRVLYLDNHVNEATRTYGFYLPLRNEPVLPDRRAEDGTVFRTWRYKPGQLVHLLVPRKRLENVYKVPLGAIVDEGLDTYVFVRGRTRMGAVNDQLVEQWRFHRTPVRVVHRSTTHAYVEPSDDLQPGRTIAMNKAHQLLLATKSNAGGSGHAHCGHTH